MTVYMIHVTYNDLPDTLKNCSRQDIWLSKPNAVRKAKDWNDTLERWTRKNCAWAKGRGPAVVKAYELVEVPL